MRRFHYILILFTVISSQALAAKPVKQDKLHIAVVRVTILNISGHSKLMKVYWLHY